MREYLRCIASVDDNIGRLLDHLDTTDLVDNTAAVYGSGQDLFLGDHGWYDKRRMLEESLQMPLIVRWPGGVKPRSVNGHLVQNLDFAQTFFDIASVQALTDMQGQSLLPPRKGRDPGNRCQAIHHHDRPYPGWRRVRRDCGVRVDGCTLIRYDPPGQGNKLDIEPA